MIAHLNGTIRLKEAAGIVVDVQGVGYQVFVSAQTFQTLPAEGTEIFLHIHSHIKEDQWSLFGFSDLEEKTIFQKLIKVSGVGPKTAMTLLSGLPVDQLCEAIHAGDTARLRQAPGIGQKAAERIVVELKGKVELLANRNGVIPRGAKILDEALSALIHLGYTKSQAESALQKIKKTDLELGEIIRLGLQNLARS